MPVLKFAERGAEGEAAHRAGRTRGGASAQRGRRRCPHPRGYDPEARGPSSPGGGAPRDFLPAPSALLRLPLREAHLPGRRRLPRRVSSQLGTWPRPTRILIACRPPHSCDTTRLVSSFSCRESHAHSRTH
jgi:hypothetical protein